MTRLKAATMALAIPFVAAWNQTQAFGQCCGDCDGDGQATVDEIVTVVNRALSGCVDDEVCGAGTGRLPATGQTTFYGSGSDGDVWDGAALSYTDNGDGTITDNNTGLMWEKKDDSGGIHDKDNAYTWGMTDPPYTMNGTMVTTFLATLNAGGGFAGHTDWRIPNIKELQSIVNYEIVYPGPVVSAAFNTGCTLGCTVTSCSCTVSSNYWSSTTTQHTPGSAWYVGFYGGDVSFVNKDYNYFVRVVRDGS
jgi:hypothetical protein